MQFCLKEKKSFGFKSWSFKKYTLKKKKKDYNKSIQTYG